MRDRMKYWTVVGVASVILAATVWVCFWFFVLLPDRRDPGQIWGVVGGALGGLVGCLAGILRTKGPRERTFVVKLTWIVWPSVIAFWGLMAALPSPYRVYLVIPGATLIFPGLVYACRTLQRIRQEESQGRGQP